MPVVAINQSTNPSTTGSLNSTINCAFIKPKFLSSPDLNLAVSYRSFPVLIPDPDPTLGSGSLNPNTYSSLNFVNA